jgi:modulator of FtsH protease
MSSPFPSTDQNASPFPQAQAEVRASYGALLGQTMMLVGLALVVLTLGMYIGRDYTNQSAFYLTIGGIVMLFAQSFVAPLRHGLVGTAWLFGLSLLLGLGMGPMISYYAGSNPDVIVQAAAGTAVTVFGAALIGTFTSHDLARWMKPVSLVVFGVVAVSWIMALTSHGANPIVSIAIAVVSAVLIVIDFNFLRRRATEDDVIWLATGIFVSIINIFTTILSLSR